MSPEPEDDEETAAWLTRFHDGNQAALLRLVERDLDWIREYVHRHLRAAARREGDTSDHVQEVTLRAMKNAQRFVIPDRESFRALIARIALNHLRSAARRSAAGKRDWAKAHEAQSDSILYLGRDVPAKCVTNPITAAARSEEVALVRLAMDIIDPADREVYELHEVENLGFREIGERIGCKEDAARKRYGTAVRRLHETVLDLKNGRLVRLLSDR